jgi:hypothetical protein
MAAAVMRPLAPDGGMQPKWIDRRPTDRVVGAFIKPNDRLTSFERLEIYNRQYWYRLNDCFYDDYPGLRAILGERRFAKLTAAYLTECPSRSFSLRNLGQFLLAFLQKNPALLGPRRKPALDMARLEWAHIEAFDNESRPPLEVDSLLGADPDRVFLKLQPHVSLLELGYELDALLIEIRRGERLRDDASNAMEQQPVRRKKLIHRHLRPKPIRIAVHRHNNTVFYKRLHPAEFHLLSAFQKGMSLAAACEDLSQSSTVEFTQVQSWFTVWAGLGWFCQLD